MRNHRIYEHIILSVTLICALFSFAELAAAQDFDLVILNGRVMDPETRYDAVANVGVKDGRIAVITKDKITAKETIDATGHVVAPGFIDTHWHYDRPWSNKLALRDGRTTVLDLEIGTHGPYIEQWYKEREGKNQVNYGQAVGHEFARAAVLDGFEGAQDVRTAIESRKGDGWCCRRPTLEEGNRILQLLDEGLQDAGLRILEARAQLGIAIGSQYPQSQQISGEATANQLSDNAPNGAGADKFFYNYQIGFDAAWEFDFWGRFRRGVESANASLYASVANYDDILVSLIAEVARTYLDIRTFEQRLLVTRENVRLQKESLDIAAARFQFGAESQLDVSQAKALLRQTQATIPPFEAGLRQAKNALAILLGILPPEVQDLLGPPKPIPTAPIEVAVGIPAELLRRRPDIRLAEFQAAAQSAQIGLAKADLYPSFSLVGSIGLQSSDQGGVTSNNATFSDLFTSGSITYFIGPTIQWPIFNYGRLKNNVRTQDARFQQLVVNYQNTVLRAFQDVEDATVGFLRTQEQTGFLSESVEEYKRSVELSLIQYSEGLSTYQRVIDSQRNLAEQEDALASATGSVGTNLIALYKALGGGWELRLGKDFIPEQTREEMRQRTDWGTLLPPEDLPENIEEEPPTGQAIPVFNKPDF